MNRKSESRAWRARLSGKCLLWTADRRGFSTEALHNQARHVPQRTGLSEFAARLTAEMALQRHGGPREQWKR